MEGRGSFAVRMISDNKADFEYSQTNQTAGSKTNMKRENKT